MSTKEFIPAPDGSEFLDGLTRLYNQVFLEAELRRLNGGRLYPISIIMADIDGLRRINQERGDLAGDSLILNAVELLRTCFRTDEIIARIGDDEFIVLLPQTPPDPARQAVERVRRRIVEYNLEMPVVRMSLSLGYATASNGEDLFATINLVKGLMLQDKRTKR